MEVATSEEEKLHVSDVKSKNSGNLQISSNWKVVGSKELGNTVTMVAQRDFSGSMALDDIASEATSIEIQPNTDNDPCTIDVKMKNGQKIVRIGISSEASVLEIFKEFGEYATTVFCEFIDEFEGCTVYLGGVVFDKPTPEASIKFTRIKNERTSMYLYGIRLVLEDSADKPTDQLDFNIISDFLKLASNPRRKPTTESNPPKGLPVVLQDSGVMEYFQHFINSPPTCTEIKTPNNNGPGEEHVPKNHNGNINESEDVKTVDDHRSLDKTVKPLENGNHSECNCDVSTIEILVDAKIQAMEARLMQRIDQAEANTTKQLDAILKKLDTLNSIFLT